jgi:hypothetical protein
MRRIVCYATARWRCGRPRDAPPAGKRPGEGDALTTNVVTGVTKRRYSYSGPGPDDRGTLTELAMYAEQGVDAVRDIPSAGELVARLWRECLDAT